MVEIETTCHQRPVDNICDLCPRLALRLAGALLVPFCRLHTSWLVECFCFSRQIANCLAILEYRSTLTPPHSISSTRNTTHDCTLQIRERPAGIGQLRRQSPHYHQGLMKPIVLWRLSAQCYCSDTEMCKNGKISQSLISFFPPPSLMLVHHHHLCGYMHLESGWAQ